MEWQLNLIFITFLQLTSIKSTATLVFEGHSNFDTRVQSILLEIQAEKDYRTIFLQRRQQTDCVDPNFVEYFQTPTVIWNDTAYGDLLYDYGEHSLIVLCLATIDDEEMLQQLSENLRFMRTTRILVLVNEDLAETEEYEISRFFEICAELDLIHVLLLHRDTFVLERHHSYTKFPSFALEVHNTSQNLKRDGWFPDRLKDLYGKNLTVLPDLHNFGAFIELNADGIIEMCGSMVTFAETFAEYMNASLIFPSNFTIDDDPDYITIGYAAEDGLIDFGIGFLQLVYGGPSHVLDISKISVAIPIIVVPPMTALFYAFINKHTLLLVIFQTTILNILLSKCIERDNGRRQFRGIRSYLEFIGDTGVRSILGQSLSISNGISLLTQYIYWMLLFAGMIFQTYFAANYSRLETFPPLRPKVSSYEEAVETDFKIYTSDKLLTDHLKYSQVFIEDRFHFHKSLDMNSDIGSVIDRSMWEMMNSYQSTSLFNENMAISDLIMLTLRVPGDSIFKQSLDDFVEIIVQSGLYKYWKRNPCPGKFVKYNNISYDNQYKTRRQLTVVDLHGVWLMYCGAIAICIFVFFCEVVLKLIK